MCAQSAARPAEGIGPQAPPRVPPATRKLLTRKQAADYVGRDRRTLEVWERRGTGPVVIRLPSGLPGYLLADLDAFIDMHRVEPSSEVSP